MSEENTKVVVEEMADDEKEKKEIILINEETIQNKIYIVRGQKVMLDMDLAEIYGYETKNFNRQVKNNQLKFEGDDFMFQLTDEEVAQLSRCKNSTLNRGIGRGKNVKYNPYVFTEQGIYMLMTVLRGDLAYSAIYAKAKKTLYVIDNYIGLKTLALLKNSKEDVEITLFSDNIGKGLHSTEFNDFCKQYPDCKMELKQTGKKYHDRYIVIDYGTELEKIFHCGPSSKDGGMRIGSIVEIREREAYHTLVDELLKMPALQLI